MLMIIAIVGRFAKAMRASLGDPVFRVLLVALVLDLIAGTLAYMWLEGWGWIDALYFCVTTQATVGFGDLVPQTDGGKLFTIVYIFAGLGLIVTFAQRLGRHLYRNVYDAEVASEGGPPAEDDRPR